MASLKSALAVAFAFALVPALVLAQNAPVACGARDHRDGQRRRREPRRAHSRRRGSEDRLNPKTRFVLVVPGDARRREARVLIGVAALPGEGNELKAMEVHIFPEAMRGTGEGFRPFDLGPKSSMTNGNISARVDATTGPKLTVTYKGGEQTIVVDP